VIAVAAAGGNLLIPKPALAWFRDLTWPRWMVPYPVFVGVGVGYYLVMATVLYRALDRADTSAVVWAIVVIAANEAWNGVFFGLRSTLGGFLGILAFTVPLAVLLRAVVDDGLSFALLVGYAAWVVYDVAWTFVLWTTNGTALTPVAPVGLRSAGGSGA
jgi:tryptophan-rich sensory protein